MILSENCKDCMYGIKVKCKSGDEYIACDMQKCQEEKMKGGEECMEEDAKQASIPYTYNAPQHDWKCGYPDNTRGKKD